MVLAYYSDVAFLKDQDVFDKKINTLPKSFSDRVREYKLLDDRVRSLGGYLLLNNALETLKVPFGSRVITIDENGKPFIENCSYFFNLSHSGERAFLTVSDKKVGCDVEKIREVDLNVAKRFFTEKESERLFDLGKEEQKTEFFKIWTRKESFIKAVGKGFLIPLNSFSASGNSVLLKADGEFYFTTRILGEYVLSVCSKEKDVSINGAKV